jgi:hypothetical protein
VHYGGRLGGVVLGGRRDWITQFQVLLGVKYGPSDVAGSNQLA